MICDIYTPDGTPFVGCPRTTLKKVIALAAAQGYSMKAGPEAEFFLFQTKNGIPTTETHDAAGYFDLEPGRHGRRRPPRDRARPRGDGLSRRGGAPRGGARASTKSTSATTTC